MLKYMKKFLPVLLITVTLASAPAHADVNAEAEGFINGLSEQALSLLTDAELTAEVRHQRFRELLTDNFDVRRIGRFVLGQYWRVATPQQQEEYLSLFSEFIVNTYADRFEGYSGEGLQVVGSQPQGDKFVLVNTKLHDVDSGEMIPTDWRVMLEAGPNNNSMRVVDVIIAGVSMSLSQRSEFAAIIQGGGGGEVGIDALLEQLRAKVGQE